MRHVFALIGILAIVLFGTAQFFGPAGLSGDLMYMLSAGKTQNAISVDKFGRSTNVDSAIATDIWDRANATDDQDIWLAPTAARIHAVVSTSANDDGDPVGTGAHTLRISGLKTWSSVESFEDITLNGAGSVNTTQSYVIIHRMQVLTSGASGPNVGQITATAATDGTVTAQILAGAGQTQMAVYGVPSGSSAYMVQLYVSTNSGSPANVRLDHALLYNPFPGDQSTVFLNKMTTATLDAGVSHFAHHFAPYKRFVGPGIIKVQSTSSANDADVSAGFDLMVVQEP